MARCDRGNTTMWRQFKVWKVGVGIGIGIGIEKNFVVSFVASFVESTGLVNPAPRN